jgi:ABC-type proline/glycine betaine transport system substrate-binding protein
MAQTTFQGPVRSLNGFITQGPDNVVDITADTTLTVAAHAGKIITAGGTLASNLVITLPAVNVTATPTAAGPGQDPNNPNNQGAVFTFFVPTTVATSSLKIVTDGTDKYTGSILTVDTDSSGAMAGFAPGATNDAINLNGSTTGGVAGSYVQVTALSSAKYMVQGVVLCTGTPATPFADS